MRYPCLLVKNPGQMLFVLRAVGSGASAAHVFRITRTSGLSTEGGFGNTYYLTILTTPSEWRNQSYKLLNSTLGRQGHSGTEISSRGNERSIILSSARAR